MSDSLQVSARTATGLFLVLLGAPAVPLLVATTAFYSECGAEMAVALLVMASASIVTVVAVTLLLVRARHHRRHARTEAGDVNTAAAICAAIVGLVAWLVAAVVASAYLFQY